MISAHSQLNAPLVTEHKTVHQRQDSAAGTAYLLLAATAALVGGGPRFWPDWACYRLLGCGGVWRRRIRL